MNFPPTHLIVRSIRNALGGRIVATNGIHDELLRFYGANRDALTPSKFAPHSTIFFLLFLDFSPLEEVGMALFLTGKARFGASFRNKIPADGSNPILEERKIPDEKLREIDSVSSNIKYARKSSV